MTPDTSDACRVCIRCLFEQEISTSSELVVSEIVFSQSIEFLMRSITIDFLNSTLFVIQGILTLSRRKNLFCSEL